MSDHISKDPLKALITEHDPADPFVMLDLVLGDVEGPDIHKKEEFDPHARYCPNCKNKLKKKDFCDVCNQKIDFLKETSEKIDKKIKEEKGKLKRIYR